ncbi:MAG: response regulator [Planctomycetes bacterium]|nr:response regulator [Planctomycetota bacterium]
MIMRPRSSTICVVDSAPDDYDTVAGTMPSQEGHLQFVPSGRAALRVDPALDPDLWIINMDLPDMSGLELYPMIRSRFPGVPIYLVANQHTTDNEIRARSSGATMYFSKPLQSEWLLYRGAHVDASQS